MTQPAAIIGDNNEDQSLAVSVPALREYLNRIGADVLNFRRFMVKIFSGHYYKERCLIKLSNDGDITVTDKEFAPTADEAAAIKAGLHGANFPKCVNATDALYDDLVRSMPSTSVLYAFYDRRRGGIVMAQERRDIQGRKAYVPWTFWSDGKWRMMEPETNLPFWKPPERTANSKSVMIHEGAKTAAAVHDLTTNPDRAAELAAHPWGNELINYEHWGMIGGALAPHRSDYAELTHEKLTEVIYVCDNDWPGKSALKTVSKCFGGPLKGIMFDERWPLAWDLADPMPPAMFSSSNRWNGPTLLNQTQLATWATETPAAVKGAGRPPTVIRGVFAEEWFHCVTPEVFVHKDWPSVVLNLQEFNNTVKPFSDVDDTARLVKSDPAGKSAVLKYSPAMKSGIYTNTDGQRYINTHIPSSIKAERLSPAPFLEFMAHLIPNEADRREMLRWVATLIAKPEIKMLYGVLCVSEMQGVGKGTLGEKILTPLIGNQNVSFPSEEDIVDNNYNYWAAHKRLAVVHEIYAGHSSKAYNKLKSVITDRFIVVNKKYQASYEIENWIHVFACSNSHRAIKISGDDRRWFVPQITEIKQSPQYWKEFSAWLTEHGGLSAIKAWAKKYCTDEGHVMAGDPAPWSSTKRLVVEEGYSPGQMLTMAFLEKARETFADAVIILDTDLVALIKAEIHEGRQSDRLEKTSTLRKLAKAQGWFVSDERAQVAMWGTRNSRAHIITNNEELARRLPSELAEEGRRPIDVRALWNSWRDV
jgi:hypothetical protein